MTAERYDLACTLAGSALLEYHRQPQLAWRVVDEELWSQFSVAVYIACDVVGIVRYVGRAHRSGKASVVDAIRSRIDDLWWRLWLVPLRPTTPVVEVDHVKGRIGRILMPTDNERMSLYPGAW